MNMYYEYYIVYDLTKKGAIEEFLSFDGLSVGIINYDLLWRRKQLSQLKDFTLLLDESSLIQNEKTNRAKFVLNKLQPNNSILLSGTVVNGNYEKLWSQCKLLGWDISKTMFYRHYVRQIKINVAGAWFNKIVGYKNVDRLKRKLRDYGAVFIKSDEVMELPKQVFQYIKCDNTKEYFKFKKDKVVKINDEVIAADFKISERVVLRQLASSWNKNKIKALVDILDSTDDRVIVFYNFYSELDEIKKVIKDRPLSIVNGMSKDLYNYQAESNSVTLVQYQAGAMGLNLQMANKIVFFSLPDGDSESFDQSVKRIHRIGQERTCFYYVLETKDSIEQEIIENLNLKQKRRNFLWEK